MWTSEEDINLLIQIVKKDMEIREKKVYLEAAPLRIAEIDRKIETMERELQQNVDSIEELNRERVRLEGKVRDQNDAINQKKITRESLKTNPEYKAMGREIEYLTKLVYQEEERILEILEKCEVKKEEVKKINERINKEKGVLLTEKEKLQENIEMYKEALEILKDEKIRILPHISEKVRRLYDRILKVKGDSGVANLVEDICQGCYSRVPPQKAHEIRKNNQILTCEVCGRILVYFPMN